MKKFRNKTANLITKIPQKFQNEPQINPKLYVHSFSNEITKRQRKHQNHPRKEFLNYDIFPI